MTLVEDAYYWVEVHFTPGVSSLTIAQYSGDFHTDGSKNRYPWSIVGSDDIFSRKEITPLKIIKPPRGRK